MRAVLESDAPWPDRYGAAQALAESGDPGLVEALIAVLRREQDPAALDALTRTLQAVQDAKAAPALLDALASPSKDLPRVGEAIRDALARIANAEAVEQMTAKGRAGALPEPQRRGVLAALARVQNPATVPALAGLLEDDTDPRLAAAAASALSRMGDEPAIAALVRAIEGRPDIAADDPRVVSLAGVDNKAACARMIGVFMAATNHPVLRHAAALALARAGEAGRAYGIGEQGAPSQE